MALPTLPRLAPLRVAVLHGGPSSEHDISVLTAGEVLSGLQGLGHRAFPVYVDREGRWHAGAVQTPAGTTGPAPMPIVGMVSAAEISAASEAGMPSSTSA